jgi:predicted enzyme related to lactoylglutathione lyase
MKFDKATIRVLVRNDFGKCFDFYKDTIGLMPVWGDRNGPYTSFAVEEGAPPCFAIFLGDAMQIYKGYEQPSAKTQPDSVVAVIPSDDLDSDYNRLKEAGVTFLGEPQLIEGWGMRCVYFRDTEGNLIELNDADSV